MRISWLTRLQRDEQGTSAVEYGLICALIILAMLSALSGFAGQVNLTWNNVSSQTQSAISHATGA